MVNNRSTLKKEILLKRLSAVVAKFPQLILPAHIEAIYVFGGMLREKERLHDIDAIFLYSQTKEQSERWDIFWGNFNNLVNGDQERSSIDEVWPVLEPYYEESVSLSKAVKSEEISKALIAKGIEPKWAGCFSWTEIVNNPRGIFTPFIDIVLQRMLLKGVRGLSAIFIKYEDFIQGKSGYSKLNTALAWSPQKLDIEANLFGRTPEEKKKLILKEIEMFAGVISDQKSRYMESKDKFLHSPVKLNFEGLERERIEITYSKKESYAGLLEKCELARNQMRRNEEELSVLNTIHSVLGRLEERKESPVLVNPIEEQVAYLTLLWQPKYKVKEKRIRELLHILGLPEGRVETIKRPSGKTDYQLVDMKFKRATGQ